MLMDFMGQGFGKNRGSSLFHDVWDINWEVQNLRYLSGWRLVSSKGSFTHMSGAWPG